MQKLVIQIYFFLSIGNSTDILNTYINAIAVSTTYQSRLTLFSKQLFKTFFIPVDLCVPTFLASEMLTLVTKWPSLDTLS